jgi:hypothetical protein
MRNAERTNYAILKLIHALDISVVMEIVDGMDSIEEGTKKLERNIDAIIEVVKKNENNSHIVS